MVKVTLASSEKWRSSFGGRIGRKAAQMEKQSTHELRASEGCYGSNVCPLPKIHIFNLVPKRRIFEWRAVLTTMVMKVEPSWMELVPPLPPWEDTAEKLAVCSLEERLRDNHGDTLISRLSASGNVKNTFFKFINFLIYSIWFQQPELRQECIVSTFWKIESGTCSWSGLVFVLPMQGCESDIWLRN